MRITKHALRRIIKEEKRKLLREGNQESAMYDRRAKEQGHGPHQAKDKTISLTSMQVNFVRYAAEVYRDQILEELIGDIPTPEEQAEIDILLRTL
jgi:hypothetical protein